MVTNKKSLSIGEIAEICDLYGDGMSGANPSELADLFHITPQKVMGIIKKYGEQFRKTELREYLE